MSIRKVVPIEEADWRVAPPPEWVETREPDWQFTPPDGYAVAFLLLDEQQHVATQAITWRSVRQPLTHAAVQALGQVEIEFDPAAHRLVIHEFAVWRKDGDGVFQKRSLARREAFLIRQREQQLEQQMLNGRASVVALIEDFRVGDAIELAWTIEPRDPLPGLRFTAFHAFVWSVPVARAYFTLHRDPAFPAPWRLHLPADASSPVENITPESAVWSVEKPAVHLPEPNVPGWHWPFPMLDVSGWTTWAEVADFVAGLWADGLADGAEAIAAEAARLRIEGDSASSLRAAIRFVQEDVRYLAVDFGHGAGMLPNGAGVVLRRRFGDCKDKAVLLCAMLRALGIEAWPLLVGSGWQKAVARVQPSTAAFSHAIVTFFVNGVRHFVDPTFIGQGGDLEHLLPPPYGCGLEVRAGATELVLLPDRPLAEIKLTETFQLDRKRNEGTVEQSLRATGPLADDVRAALVRGGKAAFFKARAESLQKHFPALAVRENATRVDDDAAANTIELHASHALPTWGPAAEKPPAMFRYGAHGLFLAIDIVEGPEIRRQPWMLRHPLRVHHRVVVRGKCVGKAKAERHRVSGPGFRYECDVTPTRGEVAFDYRWETTEPEISAKDWPQYCRERNRAFEHAGANVVTAAPSYSSRGGAFGGLAIVFVVLANVISSATRESPAPRFNEPSVRLNESDLRAATKVFQQRDFVTAGPMFEKLRADYGRKFVFQTMRAETAMNNGHFDRAREALAAARSIDSRNVATDILEAQLHERTNDLAGAREILDRVILQFPKNGDALLGYARLAERLGDNETAGLMLKKFVELFPSDAAVLLHYAMLLGRMGEHERADAAMERAIQTQPAPSAAIETAFADYLDATGRSNDALPHAKRAADLAPRDPRVLYRYTVARTRSGDVAGALEYAKQKAAELPEGPTVWSALATVAAVAGEESTATNAFHQWLKRAPGDPTALACYGYFLHRSGHTREAHAILEKAARDSPNNGLVWLNYSVVLDALLNPQGAAAARKKADALMSPEQRAGLLR